MVSFVWVVEEGDELLVERRGGLTKKFAEEFASYFIVLVLRKLKTIQQGLQKATDLTPTPGS